MSELRKPTSILTHRPLKSLLDALVVRRIRNTCYPYLTNHQQPIGVWEQIRWYFRRYLPDAHAGTYRILVFHNSQRQPVGYGGIQLSENCLYFSEGLDPVFRGAGYGTQILEAMIKIGRDEERDMVSEIWPTNKASISMATKCGFQLVSQREHKGQELLVYKLSWNA